MKMRKISNTLDFCYSANLSEKKSQAFQIFSRFKFNNKLMKKKKLSISQDRDLDILWDLMSGNN